MVVLAPGRVIRPEDIPDEVRGDHGVSLLPVPFARGASEGQQKGSLRPELEFIFRTLVDLRVDIDELKRDFEAYRNGIALSDAAILGHVGPGARASVDDFDIGRVIEIPAYSPGTPEPVEEDEEEEPVVVYRPGMTIDDMEREAISAALDQVDGNRRKAAELLGIGERTLYRKISKYGLES
jgi:DNA-binding NtrC family response regulator